MLWTECILRQMRQRAGLLCAADRDECVNSMMEDYGKDKIHSKQEQNIFFAFVVTIDIVDLIYLDVSTLFAFLFLLKRS